MARILLAALFSLLLVGMQREAVVHEVDHLRARIAQGHDTGVHAAINGECLECALLASGAQPVPGAGGTATLAPHRGVHAAAVSACALPTAAPAFYRSRAPPSLV